MNKRRYTSCFFDDGRNQLNKIYEKYETVRNCVLINKFDKKDLTLRDGTIVNRKLSPLQQFYLYLNENYIELDKKFLAGMYGVSENLKKSMKIFPAAIWMKLLLQYSLSRAS